MVHPNSLANLKKGRQSGVQKKFLGMTDREFIADILGQNRAEFAERLKKLPDDKFCLIYLKMIDLILPKIQESPELARQIIFKISGADNTQITDFEELKQE